MSTERVSRIEQPVAVAAAGNKVPPDFAERLGKVIGDRAACVRLILDTPLDELGIQSRWAQQGPNGPNVLE